jgi:dTDP-4-dehydrorhamnose 3,5-epimerase
MIAEQTGIEGLVVLVPRVFSDDRGAFSESFNAARFEELTGSKAVFVQDNESVSHKNVIRGLHFQLPPMAQGKLVRVVKGSVLDVAVDLRRESPTYGKHFAVGLSGANKKQLWIPRGFAHGFLSLEDETVFAYKCDNYYSPQHEQALRFDDPEIGISWNVNNPVISPKDRESMDFLTFESPF